MRFKKKKTLDDLHYNMYQIKVTKEEEDNGKETSNTEIKIITILFHFVNERK